QGAGDAEAGGLDLRGEPAAADHDRDVVVILLLQRSERLEELFAQERMTDIILERPFIDGDLTGSPGNQAHTGNRRLAATETVEVIFLDELFFAAIHGRLGLELMTRRESGCACGRRRRRSS